MPGVLLAFPGPLRRVTARLSFTLWAWSCGLLLRQNGLAWVLMVLCPLRLRVERTLTILVPSSLWTLVFFQFVLALTWDFRVLEERVSFPYARCNPLLHRSLGFNVEVSLALFLPILSPLLRSFSFTTKLALSNFLEGQAVHGLWSRRHYGTYSSWLE